MQDDFILHGMHAGTPPRMQEQRGSKERCVTPPLAYVLRLGCQDVNPGFVYEQILSLIDMGS